jgi:hypothetical protein
MSLVEKFRKDYKPLPVAVENVELDFVLNEDETIVTAKLHPR